MSYYLLGEICKVKGGKRIPQGETLQDEPNAHPYIKIVDMYQGKYIEKDNKIQYARDIYQSKIKHYTVNTGDVILAIVGNTLGIASIIGSTLDGANLTENCCKFVDIDESKVIPEYLYYSLISPLNQNVIQKFKVGSSQPKLPIYNIERLLIPKISIEEQHKLCSSLSKIDAQIKRNSDMVQKLQSFKPALSFSKNGGMRYAS